MGPQVKRYEALLQDKLREISHLEQSLAHLQLRTSPRPSTPSRVLTSSTHSRGLTSGVYNTQLPVGSICVELTSP